MQMRMWAWSSTQGWSWLWVLFSYREWAGFEQHNWQASEPSPSVSVLCAFYINLPQLGPSRTKGVFINSVFPLFKLLALSCRDLEVPLYLPPFTYESPRQLAEQEVTRARHGEHAAPCCGQLAFLPPALLPSAKPFARCEWRCGWDLFDKRGCAGTPDRWTQFVKWPRASHMAPALQGRTVAWEGSGARKTRGRIQALM